MPISNVRSAFTVLAAVVGGILLWSGPAQAQCGCCQPRGAVVPMVQASYVQQYARFAALQQQRALLAAMVQQQQQNALLAAVLQQQQQMALQARLQPNVRLGAVQLQGGR